jgi:hypothetical protein
MTQSIDVILKQKKKGLSGIKLGKEQKTADSAREGQTAM